MSVRQVQLHELGALGAALLSEATARTVVQRVGWLVTLSQANARSFAAAYPGKATPFAGHDQRTISGAALGTKFDLLAALQAWEGLSYNCHGLSADEQVIADQVAAELRRLAARRRRETPATRGLVSAG